MKIGLDLRMLGGGSGISRYISELSREILSQDKQNEYVLFFRGADKSAQNQALRVGAEHSDYEKYGHKIVITDIPHYSLAEQFEMPAIMNREKLDLVHFPHFNAPIFYHRPFVVTIHDLTHTKFPGQKKYHFFHRLAYNRIIRNAIARSEKIIAVSHSTRREIVDYFKVDPGKISVVYEGVNPIFQMMDKKEAWKHVTKKFGITKPYVLYVGVWRRYKNLGGLALAFDKLKDRGHDIQLVLAGEPDLHYPEATYHVSRITYQKDVKILGRVSDQVLLHLYNAADLFILPSLAEGFGLTPLEAASCGVPVACSDIPTLREIMGQGAEYFDPQNPDNMADIIGRILEDDQRREELANLALSRTKHFSWQKAAAQTINVYQSV